MENRSLDGPGGCWETECDGKLDMWHAENDTIKNNMITIQKEYDNNNNNTITIIAMMALGAKLISFVT